MRRDISEGVATDHKQQMKRIIKKQGVIEKKMIKIIIMAFKRVCWSWTLTKGNAGIMTLSTGIRFPEREADNNIHVLAGVHEKWRSERQIIVR